jgi:hypothetical protein
MLKHAKYGAWAKSNGAWGRETVYKPYLLILDASHTAN